MIFLYILLSIVAVIILLLCIRVTAVLNYNINLTFDVKWLFLKFRIYPKKEKQEKKKEKAEEDKPKEEKKKKNKKGPGPLKAFYENQGFGGVLELIKNTSDAVSGLLKRVFKSLILVRLQLASSVFVFIVMFLTCKPSRRANTQCPASWMASSFRSNSGSVDVMIISPSTSFCTQGNTAMELHAMIAPDPLSA